MLYSERSDDLNALLVFRICYEHIGETAFPWRTILCIYIELRRSPIKSAKVFCA